MKKTTVILGILALIVCGFNANAKNNKPTVGVFAEQKISEFISMFEKDYDVKKVVIKIAGKNSTAYEVYEKNEKLFAVEPDDDNPELVGRIWVYSPKLKTEKGIGVGSTFAELRDKCEVHWVSVENEIACVWGVGFFQRSGNFLQDFCWDEIRPHWIVGTDYDEEEDSFLPIWKAWGEKARVEKIMLNGEVLGITLDKRIAAKDLFVNENTLIVKSNCIEPCYCSEDVGWYSMRAWEYFEKLGLNRIHVSAEQRYVNVALNKGKNHVLDTKGYCSSEAWIYKKGKKPMYIYLFDLGFSGKEKNWKKIAKYLQMDYDEMVETLNTD
jgi:hypothetical protein